MRESRLSLQERYHTHARRTTQNREFVDMRETVLSSALRPRVRAMSTLTFYTADERVYVFATPDAPCYTRFFDNRRLFFPRSADDTIF